MYVAVGVVDVVVGFDVAVGIDVVVGGIVVGGGIVILLLLWKYKTQLSSLRAILKHFAVNRQTTRRNHTPALTN